MPYGKKLTDSDIAERLTRLRNLEQLHARDRAQIVRLKAENRSLKTQLDEMAERFESLFQKQQVRIAELEKMVFGSRGTTPPPTTPGTTAGGIPKPPKQPRAATSFRRSIPSEASVTGTTHHPATVCSGCGMLLERIRDHVRYVEDIVLPVLDGGRSTTVTKQLVQSGWCAVCQQTTYGDGIDLRGQQVILGAHVRLLTAYCMTILDMSYAQLVTWFRDLYGLAVSEGELAAIARRQGEALLPEYTRIADGIRAGPGKHVDETSYRIFSQGMGWAWCMGSTANEDVVYQIAESRGKAHVSELLGTELTGVHIHDCYAAYAQLHRDGAAASQTCWSHYYRVVRDLALLDADTLGTEAAKERCHQAFEELQAIYADLRTYLSEPFDQTTRGRHCTELLARIDWFCVPHEQDPDKLRKLKVRMQEWRHSLLTCLGHEDIPADNNKAERHIRKLVLKRKKSFGVQNLKTAKTLSVLMSVFWTYQHRYQQAPKRFLPALASLARG